jgi:hypothetical protein
VKVQVKTTGALREADGHFMYDLDVPTYEVLRREDHSVRRVLAVFRVPGEGEKIQVTPSCTLLHGCGAWVCLEGHPATTNTKRQVVRLPKCNTIDRSGLDRMLEIYGARASTPVAQADPWGQQ